MAVVLDFQSTVLDGTTAGTVAWDDFTWDASAAAYLSPVILVTARTTQFDVYRPAPNNVYVGSDYIRVALTSSGVLAATWGADLVLAEDLALGGIDFYIQFKRPDAAMLDLTNSVGMATDGFVAYGTSASGAGVVVSAAYGRASYSVPLTASYGSQFSAANGSAIAWSPHIAVEPSWGVQTNAATSSGVAYSVPASGYGAQTEAAQGLSLDSVAGLTASAGDTLVNLTWTAVTGASGYRIQYQASAALPDEAEWAANSASAVVTNASAQITSLTNGSGYYFRVRAEKSGYASAWGTASGSVTPLGNTFIAIENVCYTRNGVATWADARNTANATALSTGADGPFTWKDGSNLYYCRRYRLAFDTSSIPDGATITSAILKLHPNTITGTSPNHYVVTCPTGTAGVSQFAVAGWGTSKTVGFTSMPPTAGQYAETGDIDGVITISKTGTTYVGLREQNDIDNTTPGTTLNRVYWEPKTVSGEEPTLVVTWT